MGENLIQDFIILKKLLVKPLCIKILLFYLAKSEKMKLRAALKFLELIVLLTRESLGI